MYLVAFQQHYRKQEVQPKSHENSTARYKDTTQSYRESYKKNKFFKKKGAGIP